MSHLLKMVLTAVSFVPSPWLSSKGKVYSLVNFLLCFSTNVYVGLLCMMYFFHVGISISSIDYDLGTCSCVRIFFEIYTLEMYLKACVVLLTKIEIFRVSSLWDGSQERWQEAKWVVICWKSRVGDGRWGTWSWGHEIEWTIELLPLHHGQPHWLNGWNF